MASLSLPNSKNKEEKFVMEIGNDFSKACHIVLEVILSWKAYSTIIRHTDEKGLLANETCPMHTKTILTLLRLVLIVFHLILIIFHIFLVIFHLILVVFHVLLIYFSSTTCYISTSSGCISSSFSFFSSYFDCISSCTCC